MESYAISQIIQMAREALGYTRAELCEKCDYAFSEKTLYRIEKGETEPAKNTLVALEKVFNKPLSKCCVNVTMNNYSMQRLHDEILNDSYHGNPSEAELKLNRYKKAVSNDERSQVTLRLIELSMQTFSTPKNKDYSFYDTSLSELEEILHFFVHKDCLLSLFPINSCDLKVFYTYTCILLSMNKNTNVEMLSSNLLKNIERGYHNNSYFNDYYCLFSLYLARAHELSDKIKNSFIMYKSMLDFTTAIGDYSNMASSIYNYVRIAEKMNFFSDDAIKNECITKLKDLYYIYLAINMPKDAIKIKKHLVNKYNEQLY